MMDYSLWTSIALGIALSACAGFRVFVPMLAGALAGQFGVVDLPADMAWLGSWPAIIVFGTAALLEIIAYYIPFVDNALDALAAPLSIAAGTVLASSILPIDQQAPIIRWAIALVAGGTAAGTIQIGTSFLRLFSSKTTVGMGNPVLATTENAAAITGSVLAFFIPAIVAILLVVFTVWILAKAGRMWQKNRQKQVGHSHRHHHH